MKRPWRILTSRALAEYKAGQPDDKKVKLIEGWAEWQADKPLPRHSMPVPDLEFPEDWLIPLERSGIVIWALVHESENDAMIYVRRFMDYSPIEGR